MTVRKAHGEATKHGATVVVETPPADEQRPGPGAAPTAPVERRQDGSLTPAGARALGRRGGLATARRRKLAAELADQLGLAEVPDELAPYVEHAREFAAAQLASLATGFGEVGPGPSSMVQSAALALAASRAAYAKGDPKTGARLADQSRQALLTAHHTAELEAKARPAEDTAVPWLLAPQNAPRRGGADDNTPSERDPTQGRSEGSEP